jgi:RHS repeat-associated protein
MPYWTTGASDNQYAGLTSDFATGGEQASGSRRYHPSQGRWESPDDRLPDVYDPQSLNAYAYVNNLPTGVTDPGGHEPYLTAGDGSVVADLNGMTIYFYGQTVDQETAQSGVYDGYLGLVLPNNTAYILPAAPLTSTDYQPPELLPTGDVDPVTGEAGYEPYYPSQHSASDNAQLDRLQTGINMATTLGGAFLGGATSAISSLSGAGFQSTGFTSVGPAPEIFYRGMSIAHYNTLVQSGRLVAGSETFISPIQSFAATYGDVTVEFTLRPGTTNALESIGVRDSARLTFAKYGDLPSVQSVSEWKANNAFFKTEGAGTVGGQQINIGLGHGPALNVFNDNLIRFTIAPR